MKDNSTIEELLDFAMEQEQEAAEAFLTTMRIG